MKHIQNELASERTLKKFLRESDFTFLKKLRERISFALDEKRVEFEEQERQRHLRDEKRNELLALIEAEGFSIADFTDNKPAKKTAKRKPKYQYFENGVRKTWTGIGRTPVYIQRELDTGKPLEDFLIQHE